MALCIHFPKFTWLFASIFASIFGNIEAGKAYNLLIFAVAFFYSLKIVSKYQKNGAIILFISLLLAANPVLLSQSFSYYVDGFFGSLMLILVFALMDFEEEKRFKYLFIIFMVCVISINTKFTGFACGLVLLSYIFRQLFLKNYQNALKLTVTGICILLFGVLFTGFNPYVKNFQSNHNILYPLYGKNAHAHIRRTPIETVGAPVAQRSITVATATSSRQEYRICIFARKTNN